MDYACPVCGSPQVDRRHLANHLAFTALLRGGEHERWLDERVPGWGGLGEADLVEAIAELPPEDLAGDASGHEPDVPSAVDADANDRTVGGEAGGGGIGPATGDDHARADRPGDRPSGPTPDVEGLPDDEVLDEETKEILEEAAELTRERRRSAESTDGGDGSDATDGN